MTGQAPIVLQSMWITIVVQILTLMVAGGVSYGMTRAKLSGNEKEIVALHAKNAEIEKDFIVWQRQRSASVMMADDCDKMQSVCRDALCRKMDDLSEKVDGYIKSANLTGQSLALIIGAMCVKLDIPLPELK